MKLFTVKMRIDGKEYTVQVQDAVLQSFYDALDEFYGKNIKWLECPENYPENSILSQKQNQALEKGRKSIKKVAQGKQKHLKRVSIK